MHCDMLKIQDGGAIVEKVNFMMEIYLFQTYDKNLVACVPFCHDIDKSQRHQNTLNIWF